MRKRYLTKPEEILALKDTDTKIYKDDNKGYYKFVKGVLCYFGTDNSISIGTSLGVGNGYLRTYVLEAEPIGNNDIGRLCKFWDDNPSEGVIGVLDGLGEDTGEGSYPYSMDCAYCNWYKHCRLLSPSEVAKITGYKVEV